ncbi:ParB/RepB/Spo0J family partition protein [Yanshouia hominis]|uniref:ParB/RepB/Spo0J family partition protein n=1 Tax=Yanshouia hominis TaxID=2763673 RepID=A0ABR7NLJ2_9FIRM|nr:ParB/RepB/Spo0J family partition protein [Yanshouia hominis]MBC8577278.1 ParB/RepB/Spo0J family partition protein [Yanshouia hominis]
MADETKIPGADETPAPEAHAPETPGPPAGAEHPAPETLDGPSPEGHEEQGIIPGMGDNSVSTGKVVDLTAARAAAEKKEQPTVEDAAPKDKSVRSGSGAGPDDREPWEKSWEELEAETKAQGRQSRSSKGRTAKGAKADKPPAKDKAPTKGAPTASRKAGRPKKGKTAPIKEAPPAPAPAPEPTVPRDASSGVEEKVEYINLSELHPSPLNPFGVRDDTEMKALVESVKSGRVNQPALVRPREDGGYEIIAGHRRHKASELAGYFNMPCIVRQMTDDEAIIAMTDDNLRHREKLLPSEKALAIKQQYEAIKHQGARGDDEEAGTLSLAQVGERNGMSVKTVQRYVWLDDLVPELKERMDGGKLSFTPAVEISRIRPKLQKYIAVSIDGLGSPSQGQGKRMRELDKKGELTPDRIDGIMGEEKKKEDRDVIIPYTELEEFFDKEVTPQDMKDKILALLAEDKEKHPPELGRGDKKVEIEK